MGVKTILNHSCPHPKGHFVKVVNRCATFKKNVNYILTEYFLAVLDMICHRAYSLCGFSLRNPELRRHRFAQGLGGGAAGSRPAPRERAGGWRAGTFARQVHGDTTAPFRHCVKPSLFQ